MHWTSELVSFWIEHYYELKSYALDYHSSFYDDGDIVKGKPVYSRAPFEMQAMLNAEFSLGLKYLKKYYGEDIGNVLGEDIYEAKQKKGWAIGMLKGLLLDSNEENSTWMSEIIGGVISK